MVDQHLRQFGKAVLAHEHLGLGARKRKCHEKTRPIQSFRLADPSTANRDKSQISAAYDPSGAAHSGDSAP